MLRASLRSVSGPSRRHVCRSCIARHGAPTLRPFHYLSALRTHANESKTENESIGASNEPPFQVPRNEKTPETENADTPRQGQRMDMATWGGMSQSQKIRWMRGNEHAYKEFKDRHSSPVRERLVPKHMEMRAKIWWKKRKGAASSESSQSEAVQSAPPSEEPPKSPRPGREASSKGLQPREKVLAARQAFLEGLQSRSNSPLPEREAFVKEFQSRSNSPLPEREAFVKEFQSRSKAPQSGREAFLKDWQSRSKSKVGRNAQLAHRKLLAARDTANPFDQLVEDEIKRIAADRAAMAKESEENKRKKMVAEGIGLVNPSNPRLEEARKALFGGSVAPTPWWEENRRIPRRKAMEPGETRLVTAERAAMAKESEGNKRKEMAAERTGPVNPSNPRLEEARKALFEGSVAPTPWWEENRRIPRRKAIEPEETGLVNPSIPPPPAKVKVETLESKTQLEPGISTDSAEDSANAVAQISESGSKDAAAGSETTSPAKPPFRRKRYRKAVDIPAESGSLSADHHSLQPIDAPMAPVPNVSFGLDRVLFNPGVYQLRDYRSRVYNFDPYLDSIMPVSEFDFDTLKPYITSSKDLVALEMAEKQKKKYYGSSSSMTSVLSHFHFLLSAWRPIDTRRLSQGFSDNLRSYTRLLRAPTAMFLHYKEKEGVYAIDADKEYDSANILMNLGKSMEKLLTLPKQEFERYRRTSQNKITPEEEETVPESYHYTGLGKFLMRSQLDAYDPRLPGTGMFDLKTRAVVSIRMDASNHERGMGYEIKSRYGLFESFEREYFDMIRSAFLKYSLQVRVGRMDGIFVAYHNIERIFGFQYISLPEMDQCLHGQSSTILGDREFVLSLGLWEKIMDKATRRFPKKSLRFHFETRDAKEPFMYIIAQPVTDEEIHAIQTKNQDEIEAIQKKLFNPEPESKAEGGKEAATESEVDFDAEVEPGLEPDLDPESKGIGLDEYLENISSESTSTSPSIPETETDSTTDSTPTTEPEQEEYLEDTPSESTSTSTSTSTSAPETETDSTPEQEEIIEDLLAMTLKITNKVNGEVVERPTRLGLQDKWTIDYELDELPIKTGNDVLRQCKRRRRLIFEKPEDEEGVNSRNREYLARLQKMAQSGRVHRQRERRKDRVQGIVVYRDLSRVKNNNHTMGMGKSGNGKGRKGYGIQRKGVRSGKGDEKVTPVKEG